MIDNPKPGMLVRNRRYGDVFMLVKHLPQYSGCICVARIVVAPGSLKMMERLGPMPQTTITLLDDNLEVIA